MRHNYEEAMPHRRRRTCARCGAFQWKSGPDSPWQPARLSADDCPEAVAAVEPSAPYSGGPGYRRMQARLGAAGTEAMRLDGLRLKQAALDRAAGERAPPTDRAHYAGYPKPAAGHSRRGRK